MHEWAPTQTTLTIRTVQSLDEQFEGDLPSLGGQMSSDASVALSAAIGGGRLVAADHPFSSSCLEKLSRTALMKETAAA